MDEPRETTGELVDWRLGQLEMVERAMRHELFEHRQDLDRRLREDFMTRDQLRNTFVTRAEDRARVAARRQWPVVAFAGMAIVIQIVGLVVQIRGGR